MTDIHICSPAVIDCKIKVRYCPTCEHRRKRLVEFFEWYSPTVTCLTCGDSWIDRERVGRPVGHKNWRTEYASDAKARYRAWREAHPKEKTR
jgi:hypothetical protein